jgi:sec-independent protein translocase protein TatA
MGWLSGWELVLVILLALMFFGAGKLPKVASQLGSGIRNFQDSLKGNDEDDDQKKIEDKSTE